MSLIKRKGNECVENLHGKWVGSSADGISGNLGVGGPKEREIGSLEVKFFFLVLPKSGEGTYFPNPPSSPGPAVLSQFYMTNTS